jgi:RNA polymerase sigma factor (sigma-70 family)
VLEHEFEGVLDAAQAGADWAWRRIYEDLAGQVFGYVRSQGSREPEDLVGEVFVQLARNLHSFEGDEKGFRSWVFTIAHHRIVDERRRLRRHPVDPVESVAEVAPPLPDTTSGEALEAVESDRVRVLLEELVPAQRDVLLLRIVAGLTVREIAEITGRSEGAVKALQRRGLAALGRLLNTEGIPK